MSVMFQKLAFNGSFDREMHYSHLNDKTINKMSFSMDFRFEKRKKNVSSS